MFFFSLNRRDIVKINVAFLFFNSSILGRTAFASEALSLEQAIRLTLQQNTTLHQFSFKDAALDARKKTASLRPSLEISAEVENIAGTGDASRFNAAESTIALSSVLELGSKRQARTTLVESRIKSLRWKKKVATLSVLGKLTNVFIEGLTIQANTKLARESLHLSKSLLKATQNRSSRGAAPQAEVKRAKAALARAELQLAASESQFERQKVTLAQFWGSTTPSFSRLSGSLFEYQDAESFEQLFSRVQSSPSLQIFISETRVLEAKLALAKANTRFDLNWQIGARRLEESDDTALIAGFSMPLFSRKRNQGELSSVRALRDSAKSSEKVELLQLRTELFRAFSLRAQSIDAVNKTKGVTIPALEDALKLTRQAYLNGRSRYQDLIAAQQELLAAKKSLIESASTALISQAVIEELTGQALNP